MTGLWQVKFFPIFFKEAVMLSPGATNLIMAVTPLALAGVSFFAQAVSTVLGARWWQVVDAEAASWKLIVMLSRPFGFTSLHAPTKHERRVYDNTQIC